MARFHIVCSDLSSEKCAAEGYRHIARVGYRRADRRIEIKSREQMVQLLEDSDNSAYTTGGGDTAEVRVHECSKCGTQFLKTDPDDTKADNLRNLPDCT